MGFCHETASIWQIVGYVILIFKILIPVILIIMGTIDLGKAIVSSDDKAISKSISSFAKRIIIAVAIFFIPTIIGLSFDLVTEFSQDIKEDYSNCLDCLLSPDDKCDTSYDGGIFG